MIRLSELRAMLKANKIKGYYYYYYYYVILYCAAISTLNHVMMREWIGGAGESLVRHKIDEIEMCSASYETIR